MAWHWNDGTMYLNIRWFKFHWHVKFSAALPTEKNDNFQSVSNSNRSTFPLALLFRRVADFDFIVICVSLVLGRHNLSSPHKNNEKKETNCTYSNSHAHTHKHMIEPLLASMRILLFRYQNSSASKKNTSFVSTLISYQTRFDPFSMHVVENFITNLLLIPIQLALVDFSKSREFFYRWINSVLDNTKREWPTVSLEWSVFKSRAINKII